MPEVNSLVEALYNNFLLRDLSAKIVPGAVVLTAALYGSSAAKLLDSLVVQVGWPSVLILAGLAWVVGFAVQDLGETLRIIRHHPPSYDASEYRYSRRIRFKQVATPSESQQVERYAIIKEASGNGATAIFLSVGVFAIRSFLSIDLTVDGPLALQGFLLLVLASALMHANRSHAHKQYLFIDAVINRDEGFS